MAPLSHKKDLGTSKVGFSLINQSVTLNFELSFNERTLVNIDLRSCVLLSKKKRDRDRIPQTLPSEASLMNYAKSTIVA